MKKIRYIRILREWSQDRLALEAKVSQSKISRVERGLFKFNEGEKKRVSQALGIPEDGLFGEE